MAGTEASRVAAAPLPGPPQQRPSHRPAAGGGTLHKGQYPAKTALQNRACVFPLKNMPGTAKHGGARLQSQHSGRLGQEGHTLEPRLGPDQGDPVSKTEKGLGM